MPHGTTSQRRLLGCDTFDLLITVAHYVRLKPGHLF